MKPERIIRLTCLLAVWLALMVSCKKEEDIVTDMRPQLTVITSISGLGDMGYNDMIMSGIMKFYDEQDINMSMFHPIDMEEVKQSVSSWCSSTAGIQKKCMLLLADNAYEKILRELNISLADNQNILIFETESKDLPKGVITFNIDRYGVAYLAGCMAMKHEAATVVAAMPDNRILERAIDGFRDGYCSEGNTHFEVIYLAEDDSGFRMQNKAYQITGEMNNSFIFPVAGGSNNGVYKYSREDNIFLPLIAGMDVDCSYFSPRVPFSVVVRIDELVNEYLTAWTEGKEMEPYSTYGLASGMTDIVTSKIFYGNLTIWEDYYDSPDFWDRMYIKYKDKALSIESENENL